MSRTAFLNTIRDHPDLDAPRLVFADWLDENGDPARAEFVRVQCELARLPDHDPQFRVIEDREHELLSEHEPAWAGELPKYATEWEWRRGFVDDVTLRLDDRAKWDELVDGQPVTGMSFVVSETFRPPWLDEWGRLPEFLHHVRRLDFSGIASAGIAEIVVGRWARFPELNWVGEWNLAGVYRPDWAGNLFTGSPHTARLSALSLSGPAWVGHDEDPNEVGRWETARFNAALEGSHLRSLAINDCGVGADSLRPLLGSAWADTLTHLDISGNPLAPDAYSAFAAARMKLDSLDVSGTPLAGISLEPLLATRACESLTKLEMNGCGSARRNMEVLSRSRFWAQATELRAHSGTIPASTLEPLCGSQGPPALRLLDLADNYLRADGVRMLCAAPWTESLTWLALSRNYLDDAACEALANSRLWNLRTLHLAHNDLRQDRSDGEVITDRGVMRLTDSLVLANLRLLTLSYTGTTDRAVELVLDRAPWKLFGLGIAGNYLSPATARVLADSPNLSRFTWLDISGNPPLGGRALMPLAESPFLSPLCELDCGGIDMAPEVRAAFRERLGVRFSE